MVYYHHEDLVRPRHTVKCGQIIVEKIILLYMFSVVALNKKKTIITLTLHAPLNELFYNEHLEVLY